MASVQVVQKCNHHNVITSGGCQCSGFLVELVDGKIHFKWFEGDQVPNMFEEEENEKEGVADAKDKHMTNLLVIYAHP